MGRKINAFLGSLLAIFTLSSCDLSNVISKFLNNPSDETEDVNDEKAPVYTGMEAKNSTKETTTKGFTRDTEKETPIIPTGEDFLFEIHFSNPYRYEIQSFTINDVKYASYMFEKGSDLETLYLKSTAPRLVGEYIYTIDAIKYIDGERIRDVRIGGDQTTKIQTDLNHTVYEKYSEHYEVARSIKDGGRYILGYFSNKNNNFKFITGNYDGHSRESSSSTQHYYSMFMQTQAKSYIDYEVEVEAKFVSDDEFTLQVIGESTDWDQKYISVYLGVRITDTEPLIAGLNNPNDQTFIVYNGGEGTEVNALTVSKFKFYENYNGATVRTFAATYPATDTNNNPFEIFLGVSGNYSSLDCKSAEYAMNLENSYQLARLFEKVE